MSFGENLSTALKMSGKTQMWLAEKVGVNRASVTFWVQDKFMPSASKINEIADLLNVSPNYLLGKEDNPGGSLGKLWNDLNIENKRKVIQFAKALLVTQEEE